MRRTSAFDAALGIGRTLETPQIQYRFASIPLVDASSFRVGG
jgi:hypothetical protein